MKFDYGSDGSLTISNIVKSGSKVKLGDLDVTVTGVQIFDNCYVLYQVSWVNNGTHNSKWVERYEITETESAEIVSLGSRQ